MEGRRVLDCACNCGYFLFWSRELGAGEGLGFDAREHWIRQARFLAAHREHRRRRAVPVWTRPDLLLSQT